MELLSQSRIQSWLSWFFRGLLILGFLGLVARLVDLQVIRGSYFRALAEGNRIRRVPIVAPRGEILARGGEVLVGNTQVKKVVTFDPLEGFVKSADIEGAPEEEILTEFERDYVTGSAFAHIGGYIGVVNEDEVGKVSAACADKGERKPYTLVGRTGLEEHYECLLSGVDGEELVEVDSLGNRVRTLGRKEPIEGENLRTTIDYDLQTYIADILSGRKEFKRGDIPEGELHAAVVVTDTRGEILSLYSSPSYDPNAFVSAGRSDEVQAILTDERMLLFNRAIGGVYHPGSVFKPIVSLAALEEGSIEGDYTYDDKGAIVVETSYGVFTYNNWYFTQYGGTEGEVDVVRALARSTDTFYYKVGELTGMDALNKWTELFGLGLPTGIDVPGEVKGLVPNPEWKRLAKGERWFLGNTYHFSIGQSDTAITPLQVNQSIAALAAGGKYCKPHLNADVEPECRDIELDKENLELVIEGMRQACTAGGTGYTFFEVNDTTNKKYEGKRVACKTGTAETSDYDDNTHAWFVFFAPISEEFGEPMVDSEIVVTVLVEEGGEGSKIAGPIARAIYDHWYGFENMETDIPVGDIQSE